MEIDFAALDARDRYKLLVASVVPRPIALISTRGRDGRPNIAPFSFFNAISDEPPAVAVGVNASASVFVKDTARNIRETGEFVVNLVDERLLPQMNLCSAELAAELDEFTFTGLTEAPAARLAAPRVAESPISLECRRLCTVEIGLGRNVVIGEVIHLSVRDDLFDPERLHVDAARAGLVARMHGKGWYARTRDLLELPRPTPDEVAERIRQTFGAGAGRREDGGRTGEGSRIGEGSRTGGGG